MFRLFRVRGRSMLPTLSDGDFVVARRLDPTTRRRLRAGRVVCVEHQHLGPIIKRIRRITTEQCELVSDGQLGAESEALGSVDLQRLTHAACFAITPRGFKRVNQAAADRL
ncbi:MAG: S24/S26 family peptidase [Pseudomonadota bacterium]